MSLKLLSLAFKFVSYEDIVSPGFSQNAFNLSGYKVLKFFF